MAREYIFDAGYVKLRELAITWSVPSAMLSKWHFVKGIDLSLTGRNLWIIHKNLPYADPEQGVPISWILWLECFAGLPVGFLSRVQDLWF
ncbi:hypothetical protein ACQ86N_32665 [Puia sp. P3]|uniref:hypothetical protein n=1 Tax=Puia sp. P3 TaxID=3423952 RepID=UPI003D676ADB